MDLPLALCFSYNRDVRKILAFFILGIPIQLRGEPPSAVSTQAIIIPALPWIKTSGARFVNEGGKSVVLRGFYMDLPGSQEPEAIYLALPDSWREIRRKNWITDHDIKILRALGANCVALGFSHWMLEDPRFLPYLDEVLAKLHRSNVYAILVLRAAPGGQNQFSHGGNPQNNLWGNSVHRAKLIHLWKTLAERYASASTLVGYDLLNEPQPPRSFALQEFYEILIQAVREKDKNHVLFLQAPVPTDQFRFAAFFKEPNLAYSIHFYEPLPFAQEGWKANRYPGKILEDAWDFLRISRQVEEKLRWSAKDARPLWVSEFSSGFSRDEGSSIRWTEDVLQAMKEREISFCYYNFKNPDPKGSGLFYMGENERANFRKLLSALASGEKDPVSLADSDGLVFQTERWKKRERLEKILKGFLR